MLLQMGQPALSFQNAGRNSWSNISVKRLIYLWREKIGKSGWFLFKRPWYKRVKKRVKARNQFYLTNSFNAREPAVATFIGLEIDKVEWKWQAIIIGDSCLFHKSNSGFKSYLIEKSEDFTSHPRGFRQFS